MKSDLPIKHAQCLKCVQTNQQTPEFKTLSEIDLLSGHVTLLHPMETLPQALQDRWRMLEGFYLPRVLVEQREKC